MQELIVVQNREGSKFDCFHSCKYVQNKTSQVVMCKMSHIEHKQAHLFQNETKQQFKNFVDLI